MARDIARKTVAELWWRGSPLTGEWGWTGGIFSEPWVGAPWRRGFFIRAVEIPGASSSPLQADIEESEIVFQFWL